MLVSGKGGDFVSKRVHIKTIAAPHLQQTKQTGGCGTCQVSCQSACKTSCTVGNQVCANK
ncbi:MAG TPA: six-cysteine peptide SCIFF [Clostridia bacterium]|nr:six-cysteine peptide SCIFF [Clostridia bacterium]